MDAHVVALLHSLVFLRGFRVTSFGFLLCAGAKQLLCVRWEQSICYGWVTSPLARTVVKQLLIVDGGFLGRHVVSKKKKRRELKDAELISTTK